jgi:hypothetical protein
LGQNGTHLRRALLVDHTNAKELSQRHPLFHEKLCLAALHAISMSRLIQPVLPVLAESIQARLFKEQIPSDG